MRIRTGILIGGLALALAAAVSAQMDGGGMGFLVASDGSVLVTGGDHHGSQEALGTIAAIGADGSERWTVSYDGEWPMRLATQGDLVLAVIANGDGMGDDHGGGGNGGGGNGGGMGGGMGSGGGESGNAMHDVRLVALALADGAERWTLALDEKMPMNIAFAPAGTPIYVEVAGHDGEDHHGGGNGEGMGSRELLALGRDGTVLWSLDLSRDSSVAASGVSRREP